MWMTVEHSELSLDQLQDLVDARPIKIGKTLLDGAHQDNNKYTFYDDPEDYLKALEGIGYDDPADMITHEFSHGNCALAVGVPEVKYGIENQPIHYYGRTTWIPHHAVTITEVPVSIPHIALAAIKAAPMDPSPGDLAVMRKLLYPTVEMLEERIAKWNRQDNGLTIPMPRTINTSI